MAQIKHYPFNADRFLDRFKGQESCLTAYLDLWNGQIPDIPDPFGVEDFKTFLKSPPTGSRPFDEMVDGLYRAWDLCLRHGHELMYDAAEVNQSRLGAVHDIPREVLALRLLVEDPETFELAENLLYAQSVDKFVIYKGKRPAEVADIEAAIPLFKDQLKEIFAARKGSEKVLINHFYAGDILNFIIYHEERIKAEIQLQDDGPALKVTPLVFRPARQDLLSYYPSEGKLQIDHPGRKVRECMRKAFGLVCLGDEEFFEGERSESFVDFSALAAVDFELKTDQGDHAKLLEVGFRLPHEQRPVFTVQSDNVLATLEANHLRPACQTGEIHSAKILLFLNGATRGTTIELKHPNTLSFNRSTHAERVMGYLKRWNLIAG